MTEDDMKIRFGIGFCVEQGSCDALRDERRLCRDCAKEFQRALSALAMANLRLAEREP